MTKLHSVPISQLSEIQRQTTRGKGNPVRSRASALKKGRIYSRYLTSFRKPILAKHTLPEKVDPYIPVKLRKPHRALSDDMVTHIIGSGPLARALAKEI